MNRTNSQLLQLFGFLKNYNELRNQCPKNTTDYQDGFQLVSSWPKHPNIVINQGNGGAEALISIQRPKLTSCPPPPAILKDWLPSGWDSIKNIPEPLFSRNIQQADQTTLTVKFEDDPKRTDTFSIWNAQRNQWVQAEQPAVDTYQLFERIHGIWSRLQKEGDQIELILGSGMLHIPEQSIHHPILLQRLELKFDTSKPEFTFHSGIDNTELYKALLRDIPDIDGKSIAALSQELENSSIEPLGEISATEGFLQRAAQGLFIKGEFHAQQPETNTFQHPVIYPAPCLLLRKRNQGLSQILENILEDLQNPNAKPSTGLKRIIGIEDDVQPFPDTNQPNNQSHATLNRTNDILFSKPANAEQYAIADRLNRAHSVLVQGPPGTGKTHTIANLIGYLLSQGKTVLVCSHTSKALRVLRDKLDPAIQPLCLSVLDSDAESQTQLSQSAQEIADKLSGLDASALRRDAAQLRQRRQELLNKQQHLQQQIRNARYSEIEEIVVAGNAYIPIKAAQTVKEFTDRDGWIPGTIHEHPFCPLSDTEITALYATNQQLPPKAEEQLSVKQPAHETLVSAADFRTLTTKRDLIAQHTAQHNPDLWINAQSVPYNQLRQIQQQIQESVTTLNTKDKWLQDVLFAGWSGGGYREIWETLLQTIEDLADQANKAHPLLIQHAPEIPAECNVAILDAIITHLEQGKKLTGIFTKFGKSAWFDLIEQCKTNQNKPATIEEFHSLRAKAHLQQQYRTLAKYWQHTVAQAGGAEFTTLGSRPELTAPNYIEPIRKHLNWRLDVWEPLQGEIEAAGFHWEKWLESNPIVHTQYGELERIKLATTDKLASLFTARAALLQQSELSRHIERQATYLSQFPQSEIASDLVNAQQSWDADSYENLWKQLAQLEGLKEIYQQRSSLLEKLHATAPDWAKAIWLRMPPHNQATPPGSAATAWHWLQLQQALEKRAAVSIPDLQQQLDGAEREIAQLAAKIIEQETWAAQGERTHLSTRQALMGFVGIVRKIGKGKGKRVPTLLKEARNLLLSARKAVPVWIMPLNRVYESFDPRDTRFDVVIIDESSQSDMMALAALYLGKEHVVVGDKEQVTPDAIGQQLDSIQKLIDTDLLEIPNKHLYDGQTSVYDLAETAFGGVISLKEHFRCVPEIIQFSNHLSYHNKIRPLREPLSSPLRPALISHRVEGARNDNGKINHIEAETIASLIIACIHHPTYARNDSGQTTTFGAITLLGSEQSEYIDNILRHRLELDLYNKHKVLCGNPAQFQGDERDVIFLSMVDSPPDDGVLNMMGFGKNDMYKKRYNVAVSRARNQLWLIHSLDPENHLKSDDIRRRLIQHVRDPQALMREVEVEGQRTDSPFEKAVLADLVNAGYRVKTQWQVGAYRIDIVVEGQNCRLAIECDGDKYHTPDNLQQDIERQTILERLGWTFVRIRGSLYYRYPERAMQAVFTKLNELGIEKLGISNLGMSAGTIGDQAVIQDIRRSAETIRQEWEHEREIEQQQKKAATSRHTKNVTKQKNPIVQAEFADF
ncbi:AAA domain-containing protein [Candidatus Thiothrix sp. Deng01]|uniref:AAA domain-containing protein n=1 Tax=Candidatus Thiothrix phosphatis TaxID=3112415 RepID=A0ABU6CYC3_9GAMM|nr:AAA domain-containing protein [Candidatus Thiothrix sp. Deng01]MEB4591770.1 AAA domain-containing protein [Candidatus Thiothrix sp. Deng01]